MKMRRLTVSLALTSFFQSSCGFTFSRQSRAMRSELHLNRASEHEFKSKTATNLSLESVNDHQGLERRKMLKTLASYASMVGLLQSGGYDANAMYTDQATKIVLPSVGEIEASLPSVWEEADNPFVDIDEKTSFGRLDSKPDSLFYTEPRFGEHVDENAVEIMTKFINEELLHSGDAVLDLCTSWTSHIRKESVENLALKRISGLGMNEEEMKANPILTDYKVVDLNERTGTKLPYDGESFDLVICQLSIDYLTRPLDVMKEVSRVLKPGGEVAILFSNRLFIEKAVGLWTGKDDIDHTYTVGSYLQYCNGGFRDIRARDLSKRKKGKESMIIGDPMYVVTGIKA